ncbi:hypothetical protein SAMN04489724_3163 [Algoriphagus locisalis]|uniref:C-terminal domain of CHU protein family protein n=1 Tax=Algoriphagus locisalis TaxID=305507 RepID=A0A1I7CGB0_9BACT|nr:hypothetical protein [Algoriphagus locisalis]SFT98441.1 hypothetical protein SAMN04489724_3163 [Algoriphagus locisalis]
MKIGMILVLILLNLTPLVLVGEEVAKPNKPELSYLKNIAAGIAGPTELCIVLGIATGEYSITAPTSAEYTWVLQDPNGNSFTIAKGGANSVGTIQVRYTVTGTYQLILEERSSPNASPNTSTITVEVNEGPAIVLKPDYLLCGENIPTLQALDSTNPELGRYEFTWARDEEFTTIVKQGVGAAGNELTPTEEGYYYVMLRPTLANSACIATSTTYVGPPVDFEFVQNKEEICEGESVKIELDTPISGEWWYRKQGESTKITLGNTYSVTLGSSQFTEPGIYEVGFIGSDQNSSCTSERITTVRQKEGPKLETADLVQPSSCGASDGSFQITAENDLISLRIVELNLDLGPQAAGTELTIPNLEPGVYTIEAATSECGGYFFHALNLPAAPDETDIVTFKEECVLNGINLGRVEITFPNGNVSGDYRILSGNSGISTTGTLTNEDFIAEDLPGGIYYFDFEYSDDSCHPLIETFTIDRRRDVPFSLPEVIELCDTYDLSLKSSLNLNFELTRPDGTVTSATTGESFLLSEEGEYSLYIEPVDLTGDYCPVIREFSVNKLDYQIEFGYEIIDENCLGDQIWGAVMENLDIEDAIFRWYNGAGEIVGRSQEFRPINYGEVYQLTVQPKATAACNITPLDIQFNQPILSVPAALTYEEECELFIVNLEVLENEELVKWIEWTLFLEDGSRVELDEGTDLYEITDDRIGVYEAILYRDKESDGRCEVARVNISIEERTITPPPTLEESYPFCSKGNGIPPIAPGKYESYSWRYLNGDVVVGTDSTFYPAQAGNYELTVLTAEGCIYEEEFRVYDVCEIDYVFPNAMILDDPDRDFRVTVSEGVTEAELYVINSTGELIHQAEVSDISYHTPILIWDGTVGGNRVPQGTYAIVLIMRNPDYGLNEKVTGSFLVLE